MNCIVQIGPYPESPSCIRGGVEASVFGLAQEQGCSSEVHVFDWPRINGKQTMEKDGEVTVHRYCNRGSRQLFMVRQVSEIVHEIHMLNPDVCHVHGTTLFSWSVYQQLRKKGQKVILTIHGLIGVEKLNLLKKNITLKRLFQYMYQSVVEKWLLSHVSVTIVDTEYVKKMVEQYSIWKKPEMYVIPQGISESFFGGHCSADSKVFLSVGAIGKRKGHLLTLRAFEQLRQEGVEARLVIAGTLADKAYCKCLQDNIQQSDYQKDIELQIDLSNNDLYQLFQNAHVVVLHTEEESQGIVFAEAMAMGMPVVSTRVGGVPYVVKDGVTGLLSKYGDVSEFANSMKTLMLDKKTWQFMSDAAQAEAHRYHWSIVQSEIEGLYTMVD